MPVLANERSLLHANASRYAFKVGQLAEQIVIERALEMAQRSNSGIATVEHAQSSVDAELLHRLRELLKENSDGEVEIACRRTA